MANSAEQFPNPELENLRKNVALDIGFLSRFKDTDTIPVLVTYMGGKVYGGSGHEMEPELAATYDDDRKEWEGRSAGELKELVLKLSKEPDILGSISQYDYPLAFKDPSTEEEHQSAYGKQQHS